MCQRGIRYARKKIFDVFRAYPDKAYVTYMHREIKLFALVSFSNGPIAVTSQLKEEPIETPDKLSKRFNMRRKNATIKHSLIFYSLAKIQV